MGNRKYMNTIEAEAVMNQSRVSDNYDGKAEMKINKALVASAKANMHIGDKILMCINPIYVHFPSWQRADIDVAAALRIGREYDPAKWELPKILYDKEDGKFYTVDGMHRIYGTFLAGMESVVVEILEMSKETAIKLFLSQTENRRPIGWMDKYRASIVAEIPEFVKFRNICHSHNVLIKGDSLDELENPIGTWNPISDGVNLVKRNPDLCERIVVLIGKLQWNGSGTIDVQNKAYGSRYIRAIKKLYAYYEGHEKEMEFALMKHCMGAEFFNKEIYFMSQTRVFDTLSNFIRMEIEKKEKEENYTPVHNEMIRNSAKMLS